MLNKELFSYDPTQRVIPNGCVAKVGRPENPEEWATLRFELENFVCEGEYGTGLERILSGFLANLDQGEQPAVWVSGFYGSGKSHFLKVLDSVWSDSQFPSDGARARGVTDLSEGVRLALRELDAAAKREGGLWSASGALAAGAVGSTRLAFLEILFAAAGLPTNYEAARLTIWMKREGIEDHVRQLIERDGRSLERELANMYVSPSLAAALFEAAPGLAESPSAIPALLQAQYMLKGADQDISDTMLLDTLDDVMELVAEALGKPGKRPLVLVIMDELEQYIGEDAGRSLAVQLLVEKVSSKLGSRVLFVASGQSAMGKGGTMLKLQGRFTGRVELTDTDVDRVVRRVILMKRPDKAEYLAAELADLSGEIDRHLQGTKLATIPEDSKFIVADYPLLPTRRRFWEWVLRAIDNGSAAKLRNQLRAVQEATKYVAGMDVGVVVPGDFIYTQQVNGMLHTGKLPKDLHETIEGLKDGSVDGGLRHRVAALVFLITQLKQANKDLGVRANASTLADLLIANLNDGSAMLRSEVEQVLSELADSGVLQAVDGEYSLQGKVGAEWQQDYTQRVNGIKDETARIGGVRSDKLRETLQRHIGGLTFTQGTEDRVARRGQFVYGAEAPDLSSGFIPVWVRDEWTVGSLKAAQEEAAARGSEDPVVHLLIPKRDAQAIKDEIVKLEAAQETLDAKPTPTSDEGATARAGIQARRDAAEEQLRRLMAELMTDARVFTSGGNEMREADLRASVEAGLRVAAQRMFPRFAMADGNWGLVVQRASQGSGTALEVLGYQGDPKDQKVCAEVIKFLGSSGKKGSEVRDHFMASPYGWSKDAVDGSLMVMARADRLKVQLNGTSALAFEVTQDRLGKFTFAVEQGTVLTVEQKLQLKKMFVDAGVPCPPNGEAEALASFLAQLIAVGQQAGGTAPRPAVPDLQPVRDLESLSGNERMAEAWARRDELQRMWTEWHRDAKEIERRMAEWAKLETLAAKGSTLAAAGAVKSQMEAIVANRSLLAEPDPVRPLIATLVDAIRAAVQERHAEYKAARENGIAQLEAVDEFRDLSSETWRSIVEKCGLGPLAEIALGTDTEVLAELDRQPLETWRDRIDGMKGRIDQAREEMAKAVAPETKTYSPPLRRLTTTAEVEAYIAEVRAALMDAIDGGTPVIIQR